MRGSQGAEPPAPSAVPPVRPGAQPAAGNPVPDGNGIPPPQARPAEPPASAAAPESAARPSAPESPAPLPAAPAHDGFPPRPGTAVPPAPRQSSAAPAAAPPPAIEPEILLKEALGQMVAAAELPLGSPAADSGRLGAGNKMPPAVLDKAAAILLRAAGLSPDPETMDAAKALVTHNVPVDRDSVQALLSAAAGVDNPEDRAATLRAAARLLAKDIPLAPPLVAGMADVIARKGGVHQLMEDAARALAPDPAVPEAEPLMRGARELLATLHVDLENEGAGAAIARFASTLGREALGKALGMVELSAQAVLEGNAQLRKIDEALNALLGRLLPEMEASARQQTPVAEEKPPSAPPPPPPPSQQQQQQPPPQPPAAPAAMRRPIHAYLNAPKALPIEEMLKNLPPMPKVVSLGTPPPAIPSAGMPAVALPIPPAIPPLPQTPPLPPAAPPAGETPEFAAAAPAAADPEQVFPPPPRPSASTAPPPPPQPGSGVLNKLDSLFQIPGLNRPELELLRPGGFLDRFLDAAADQPPAPRARADADALLRELLSDTPRAAARARDELPQRDSAVLRQAAARLSEMETELLRADPLVSKLADAATSLRDLGRQLLATKAENLAAQDRNPAVVLAEVPFKLNDDAGDGRMQMFYRRGKKKGDGWSSRVILDLNTTRIGPILGDMRFFGQDMTLNLFVDRAEAADYLSASAGELEENLSAKGFRVKMKCMVLPPPPPAPTLDAERPLIAGEEAPSPQETPPHAANTLRGRLDIEM